MPNRISRRRALLLAALPVAPAMLVPGEAASESPRQLLNAQRKSLQAHSRILASFKLKQSVEPAFQFRP